jgi:secreted PhoX family phosphatase
MVLIRAANPEIDATSGGGARRVCAMQHKCVGRLFNRQIAVPDMQNEHDRLTTYADAAGPLLLIASALVHKSRPVAGAEMCGPAFTPNSRTLFVAVQPPAADVEGSSYDRPVTRWPDFSDSMPPRPATVVITKRDGGLIGS